MAERIIVLAIWRRKHWRQGMAERIETPAIEFKRIVAWGEDRGVKFRESRYHGRDGVLREDDPVWIAEIMVGPYPYAAWGETKDDALSKLREKMNRIEQRYPEPPADTTTWHLATMEEG